jgi:hypothetical protein
LTERKSIYRQLRDIYNYRSQVAHSGMLCGDAPKKIEYVRTNFPEYMSIAERIIHKLIVNGKPDWAGMILGAD